MKNPILATLVLLGLALAGCSTEPIVGPSSPDPELAFPVDSEEPAVETVFSTKDATDDLVDTAVGAGFNTLVAAVQAAGLEDALRGEDKLTVFAPTDEAFGRLPAGLVDRLLLPENKSKLQEVLLYHVVAGEVRSRDLRFFQRVETLQGDDLEILRFFRLIRVNETRVTTADVKATNGVIHVIKDVLIPPGFTLDEPEVPTLDLVGTAVANEFNTLVAAVQAAGLVEALQGDDPLTVFAPTDAAFTKLPDELLAELLLEENQGLLQELLLYHVVGGQVLSGDLARFQVVEMAAGGKTFIFKSRRGDVRINRSRVVAADVLATNGVVHAIDRVLIPFSFYGQLSSLPPVAPDDRTLGSDL